MSHSHNTSANSSTRANQRADEADIRAAAPTRPLPREASVVASGSHHAFLERAATILFPILFVCPLLLSGQQLVENGVGWMVVPGVLTALVFADFVTGFVHWAADTYGDESTPGIGRNFVRPFRVHHVRPQEICEHSVVETIGNTCIFAAPPLKMFTFITAFGETSAAAAFAVFTGVVTVGVTVATNQFHKWAHHDAPPRIVRALQRSRIILSPEHHLAHHTAPFESSYAITNGWLNPLLDWTCFFRRLEGTLRAVGVKPSSKGRM